MSRYSSPLRRSYQYLESQIRTNLGVRRVLQIAISGSIVFVVVKSAELPNLFWQLPEPGGVRPTLAVWALSVNAAAAFLVLASILFVSVAPILLGSWRASRGLANRARLGASFAMFAVLCLGLSSICESRFVASDLPSMANSVKIQASFARLSLHDLAQLTAYFAGDAGAQSKLRGSALDDINLSKNLQPEDFDEVRVVLRSALSSRARDLDQGQIAVRSTNFGV